MKAEKFNGHGSFETFLVQFENCCRYNDWNRKDKAAHRSKVAGATYLRALMVVCVIVSSTQAAM